jgi:defect-in-organelle-trafficking protein DotD
MIKSLTILSSCFLLSACATQHYDQRHTQSIPTENNLAYVTLAEAAASVSQSITSLGETEQAAHPPASVREPPQPETYGMGIPTSIDWDGPIEPLIQQIANAANYKLRVLGSPPAIPVIVSISAKDTAIGDILRDIGYQSGQQAQVVVFPSTRIIELRYAKS